MRIFEKIIKGIAIAGCVISFSLVTAAAMPTVEEYRMVVVITQAVNKTVMIKAGNSRGTGFFLKYKGKFYLLTNNHVIDGNEDKVTYFTGQKGIDSKVLYTDSELDVALLKIEGIPKKYFVFASYDPRDFQQIFSVGFSSTYPYVIREGRIIGNMKKGLVINSNIHFGDSGGPLLDSEGRLLGIIYAKDLRIPENGLAIPFTKVREYLDNIAAEEKINALENDGASLCKVK